MDEAANGNPLADGARTYSWDAENRLIGIDYTGQPGKQTAFTYDGLSRRVAIGSTPAGGGSTVTTSYIWCGSAPCQARDATNATLRQYLDEGEFVPGTPGQPYYYGIDQIGSVRRVFASTSTAPTYAYDPYGNPLQGTAPLTDFGYAGMFQNPDSGLNLTQYRAYDPTSGRWLSRDPLEEDNGEEGLNLYAYVTGNPVSLVDPLGLACKPRRGGGPPKVFLPPTNPPRNPPTNLPPGHRVRTGPPSDMYPNGYWKQENASGQPVDPSTGKPPSNVSRAEARARTHVEFPPVPPRVPLSPWAAAAGVVYDFIFPSPAY